YDLRAIRLGDGYLSTWRLRSAAPQPGCTSPPPDRLRARRATAAGAMPSAGEIRPERTLWLLAIAHAVNHAQAVILPPMFLLVVAEFHVGVEAIPFLAATAHAAARARASRGSVCAPL